MLESLENNEVILLMYLAGELPPVDRGEVAQMLAGDANLRRELDRLREMTGDFANRVAALDRAEPITSEAVIVRRLGRAMRRQLALQAEEARRNAKPARNRFALAWWAYPGIAAAAIFLAFLTWVINYNVGNQSLEPLAVRTVNPDPVVDPATNPVSPPDTQPEQNNAALAQDLENSFGASTEREDNQLFALGDAPQVSVESDKNE